MKINPLSLIKKTFFLPAGIRSLQELTPKIIWNDMMAGIVVASVAVPIGLAYATLIGLPPIIGLYACIIPVFIYALFGPSSYLIIGPDAAVSNIVGASLTAFALTTPDDRIQGAAAIAIGVGIFSIIAGKLRLGFIANFLSRPILTGYLAGIGIDLMISQIPIITRISIPPGTFLYQTHFFLNHLATIHWMTFGFSLLFFIFILLCNIYKPSFPAPVFAIIIAIILSWTFDLSKHGMSILGSLPSGLPSFHVPSFHYPITEFVQAVAATTIISFSSGIITARSFAAKIGKTINANQELVGFGISNIFSGLFQSFTVTGADSRTAVGISCGGKTALVGISCAVMIAITIIFLTVPLGLLPSAILSVILMSTAMHLIDVKTFLLLYKVNRIESYSVLITIIGVLWMGVLQGIILAVVITLLHGLFLSAYPRDTQLGTIANTKKLISFNWDKNAQQIPHCIIYVFEASIVFFNEDYFISRCQTLLEKYKDQSIRWFILDAAVMTQGDVSTLYALNHLHTILQQHQITLVIAGGHYDFRNLIKRSDIITKIAGNKIYPSSEIAVQELKIL